MDYAEAVKKLKEIISSYKSIYTKDRPLINTNFDQSNYEKHWIDNNHMLFTGGNCFGINFYEYRSKLAKSKKEIIFNEFDDAFLVQGCQDSISTKEFEVDIEPFFKSSKGFIAILPEPLRSKKTFQIYLKNENDQNSHVILVHKSDCFPIKYSIFDSNGFNITNLNPRLFAKCMRIILDHYKEEDQIQTIKISDYEEIYKNALTQLKIFKEDHSKISLTCSNQDKAAAEYALNKFKLSNKTAMDLAWEIGNVSKIKELQKNGVELTKEDHFTFENLLSVIDSEFTNMIKFLHKNGAHENNEDDINLLEHAYKNNKFKSALTLLECGFNEIYLDQDTLFDDLIDSIQKNTYDQTKFILAYFERNNTQIEIDGLYKIAIKHSNADTIGYCATHGKKNPNIIFPISYSPLYLSCSEGHCNLVKKLLNAGANPNFPNEQDENSTTLEFPLNIACEKGFKKTIKLLVEYGADLRQISEADKQKYHKEITEGLENRKASLKPISLPSSSSSPISPYGSISPSRTPSPLSSLPSSPSLAFASHEYSPCRSAKRKFGDVLLPISKSPKLPRLMDFSLADFGSAILS